MSGPRLVRLPESIVEIVSDAGEGAQKAALSFAQVCAKAGNLSPGSTVTRKALMRIYYLILKN